MTGVTPLAATAGTVGLRWQQHRWPAAALASASVVLGGLLILRGYDDPWLLPVAATIAILFFGLSLPVCDRLRAALAAPLTVVAIGALAAVTGGHDSPVMGLLVAVVLHQLLTARPRRAGLVVALAVAARLAAVAYSGDRIEDALAQVAVWTIVVVAAVIAVRTAEPRGTAD